VVVAYRIGWPDEQILRGKLSDIVAKVELSGVKRTAMVFIGRGLEPNSFRDSALYHEAHSHVARSKS
jgi:precorrin-4/cobalt-precorrin-4 C11-methyltransferase